jgi:hypothetical protein
VDITGVPCHVEAILIGQFILCDNDFDVAVLQVVFRCFEGVDSNGVESTLCPEYRRSPVPTPLLGVDV